MTLDFPASPNINDTYTFGGVTWTYDGTTWKVLGRFQFTSTETDPVFTASPAFSILNQNITNWNLAYGWGDHSTAGYLSSLGSINGHTDVTIATLQDGQLLKYSVTNSRWENWTPNYLTSYTETDPVFTASPAGGINATNIANWNTAYNWGNHSTQGYLTAEADTLDTVLTRGSTTTQDITTTGKVYFSNNFANSVDLPSATTYHGMFAHVHAEGHGYFAHAGAWTQLVDTGSNLSELADVVTTAPNTSDVLTWDGANWAPAASAAANVTISDTAPGLPSAGDLWWESDKGRLKIYYNDTDSTQWVDASPPLQAPNSPVIVGEVDLQNVGTEANWYGTSGATVTVKTGEGGANFTGTYYSLNYPVAFASDDTYIVQATVVDPGIRGASVVASVSKHAGRLDFQFKDVIADALATQATLCVCIYVI